MTFELIYRKIQNMKIFKILSFIPVLYCPLGALATPSLLEKTQLEKAKSKAYAKYRILSSRLSLESIQAALSEIEKFFNELKDQYAKVDICSREGCKYDDIPRVLGRLKADIAFLQDLIKCLSGELSMEIFRDKWQGYSKYSDLVKNAIKIRGE